MNVSLREIRVEFVGMVDGLDLRLPVGHDDMIVIQEAIGRLPVLVFPSQAINDEQQAEFSRHFGRLSRATEYAKSGERRLGSELTDASNLNDHGGVLDPNDRRLMNTFGSRRWHTDGSYKEVPGRYSFLSGRVVPSAGGETQFADMRAAYDALPLDLKAAIDDLVAEHDIMHSRGVAGFTGFSEEERMALPPVRHRLVRKDPKTGRKSLYLSSHASHIVGRPLHEGIDLLRELSELATQPQFVYTHFWRPGDLVMWDNRITMHRVQRHTPPNQPRDMRRTTTLDEHAVA